jgi:predicted Zn-dependent protease
VELDSTLLVTHLMLGTAYPQAARYPDAIREMETALRRDSTSVQTQGMLGYVFAKTSNATRTAQLATAPEASVGKVSGAAADHDLFHSSESLTENFFDPVRADPRFARIVSKTGLDRGVLTRQ